MSENESWKGTLTKILVPEDIKTWKEQVEYLQQQGHHFRELDFDEETFYYKKSSCAYLSGEWYLLEAEEFDDQYTAEMKKVAPDTYEFLTIFYNGGTCLDEMLEDMMKRVKKDEKI